MARKDERGVMIPAPLQFNNPASASLPRYDDEHRGPAVTGAYELSRCRIDLAERSEAWPAPENLPSRMLELAQAIPDDQRADWLRRQANLEEVHHLISRAMRSGELPIWVAPIGEPERLVAPSAMVEIDKATIVSGIYRPPNDRGWLFGRPLFVKRDDWAAFVERVQSSKGLQFSSPTATFESASRTFPKLVEFEEANPDWFELWQGPIHFRATYDRGHFGPGHSLERINQYGQDGATGGGRHKPIYTVRLDPDDGAIVIEWLIGLPGRQPPFQSVRYYQDGPGRGRYERLKDDARVRDQYMAHLPSDQRERAVGAYACGVTIREWAQREFFEAVHAGHCEIWARVGSKVAPFRRVPADIFRSYRIQQWGYGVPGGAWATLEDAEPLYSIRVAPAQADQKRSSPEPSRSRLTPVNRQLDHAAIIAKAGAMLYEQPNLSKGAAAASIVVELPVNPRTGKHRDTRHIERMIAHLWEGDCQNPPEQTAFP